MRAFIELTPLQRATLEPIFKEQETKGGAIAGQIWRDGINIKLLTEDQQQAIAKITNASGERHHSALSAYANRLPK